MKNSSVIADIRDLVARILPFDELEAAQIGNTLSWIQSGATLFRVTKPDVPNRHLVSYFVLFDADVAKILLVDHCKAQLWLPTGGHVNVGEHPTETVRRECFEELGVKADFWRDYPIFLTSTSTVGLTAGHTDVSLWYVIKGSCQDTYVFDGDEFNEIRWFSLDEIPYEKSDPQMRRFIKKLKTLSSTRRHNSNVASKRDACSNRRRI